MSVLPHRIAWIANVAPTSASVSKVDFLIDGRTAWTEHEAPYTYADDGGYLVTSWLSPGSHSFEARVVTVTGSTMTDKQTIRVTAAPTVPAALAGTWKRKVKNTSAAPKGGSSGNPTETLTPSGSYRITFDRRWIHDEFPCDASPCTYNDDTGAGGELDSDWTPRNRLFEVRGSVTFKNNSDTARLSGWWCENNGPDATYSWSVSGNVLTLKPQGSHDACGIRGFIWAGRWTRTS